MGAARVCVDRGQAREVQRDRAVQGRGGGGRRRGPDVASGSRPAGGGACRGPLPRRGHGLRRVLSVSRRPGVRRSRRGLRGDSTWGFGEGRWRGGGGKWGGG